MHHVIVFIYFESGKLHKRLICQIGLCHISRTYLLYYKRHSHGTHRKTTRLPGWEGPTTSILRQCQAGWKKSKSL